jgi:hypothetical protein
MRRIETTTRALREGLSLGEAETEVVWESTGHLSVRLLDASGSIPLGRRSVTVDIPGEGNVRLETDADGRLAHPDVPFRDYELDLDGLKIRVPAVGERHEVHERHAATVPLGFVHAVLLDAGGLVLEREPVRVEFPAGVIDARTDGAGVLLCRHEDPGEGEIVIRHARGSVKTRATANPQKLIRLRLEASE